MSEPTTELALQNFCALEGLYFDAPRYSDRTGDEYFIIRPFGYSVMHVCVYASWKLRESIVTIRNAAEDWRKQKYT